MHVVTFYSFKGGVGRTLALVNIGVELANTGRRVLLVDFDLEAPGIDTFEDLAPPAPNAGIVDYITEYLASGSAPDFGRFRYAASQIGNEEGKLWVMPSGRRDAGYGSKLASIDWQELYEQHDGFLLMEHLKGQWQESLKPDYILIDSRTGHSEVGGICTRQLPNTVVILFMPNEQNLEGVATVVDAIRAEKDQTQVNIDVELVASNVPSLDDEYQILRTMMRKFENRLLKGKKDDKRSPISLINRYDSLHLLNQTVFVTRRPQSRLAKQYRALLRRIVEHNLEDREAALREISNQFPRPSHGGRFGLRAADFEPIRPFDSDKRIQDVLRLHADDAEINFMIGQLHKSRGELEAAQVFFSRAADKAISTNDRETVKYELELIETLINQGKHDGTVPKLLALLENDLKSSEVRRAVALLVRNEIPPPKELLDLRSLSSLVPGDLDGLAWDCCVSREWQQCVVRLYQQSLEGKEDGERSVLDYNLMLAAIGTKNYHLLLHTLDQRDVLGGNDIVRCFNFAMAQWGVRGKPDVGLFSHVLELDNHEEKDANYAQCLALSTAITGDREGAKKRLDQSRRLVGEFATVDFSCWRYLRVGQQEFLQDLEEIASLIDGENRVPVFMR